MSGKWTSGPWKRLTRYIYADGPNGSNVAACGSPRRDRHVGYTPLEIDDPDFAEAHANAELIAAAPDLYSELAALLARYVGLVNSGDAGNWDPEKEPEVIAARKALAKARGEAGE